MNFPNIRKSIIQMARNDGSQGIMDENELADRVIESLQSKFAFDYLDQTEMDIGQMSPRILRDAICGDRDSVSMTDHVRIVLGTIADIL